MQVFGIDCGINQVCHKIRSDPRVVVMEQFNLRHLLPHHLPSPVSLVTLDLSFISVLKVMPAVTRVVTPDAHLVVLIKPQFEAGREQVGSGGIVRDPAVREQVVQRISAGVEAYGWLRRGVIESPIKGDANNKGNTEYVAHFVRDAARRTAPLDETTTTDGPPSSSTGTASDDGQDEDTAGGRVAATG